MTVSETRSHTQSMLLSFCFVVFLVTLLVFAILAGRGIRTNLLFFWIGLIGLLGVFLIQAFYLTDESRKLILVEMLVLIVAFSFLSFLMKPEPPGFDYDGNFTIGSSSRIMKTGWPLPAGTAPSTVSLVADWPALSIVVGTITLVAGSSSIFIFGFLPPCLHCLLGISVFLFARRVLSISVRDSAVAAVVGLLSLGTVTSNVFMNQGMGMPLMYLSVYLVGRSSTNPDLRFKVMTVLVMAVLVLTHHLSAFYLVMIVTFFFLYNLIVERRGRDAIKSTGPFASPSISVSGWIVLLLVSLVALYWSSVGISVIESLYFGYVGVSSLQTSPIGFFSNSGAVLSNSINGMVALVMILVILLRGRSGSAGHEIGFSKQTFSFSAFMVLAVLVSARIKGAGLEFTRSMGVAWVLFVCAFLSLRPSSTLKRIRPIIVLLLLLYCGNQFLAYTGSAISPFGETHYSNQGYVWGGPIRETDLQAIVSFPQQQTIIGDQIVYSLAEGWMNENVSVRPEVFRGNLSAADGITWFFLRDVNKEFVFCPYQSSESFGVSASTLSILNSNDRVFDNGGVEIYRIGTS